jgi:hypothetical protein
MQKCFMCKLYSHETILFLQGCTIVTICVTADLFWQFMPSRNSKSIPKLQIRQQDKHFDDEKKSWLCLYFVVCTPSQIKHGGFIRARMRKSGVMIRDQVCILYLLFLWVSSSTLTNKVLQLLGQKYNVQSKSAVKKSYFNS